MCPKVSELALRSLSGLPLTARNICSVMEMACDPDTRTTPIAPPEAVETAQIV